MEQSVINEQGQVIGTMEDDFDDFDCGTDWIGDTFAW